jgi:pyruvate,water dikinase
MAATTDALGAFPSPFSIATPDGCDGWEEMYPYYSLFTEQRPRDEDRLWFWNSMHFPVPMPPFDVTSIDTPYQAAGGWQHRAFRTPPAMGIDYRIINGYVYISVNGVDDPDMIAERARFFQERAGHYFGHWDDLYAAWRERMRKLIAHVSDLPVPELPEYEPDDVIFGDRPVSYLTVLDSYRQALSANEQMWSNHFEFLLLGYGAYLTFSEFCKAHLPDIPDQHISQMIAGIDVLLFRPDAELRRLPSWRSRRASTARSSRAARPPRSTPSWAPPTPAAPGSTSSRPSRTHGSTWPPATASITTSAAGTTTRASPTPR